jgi:hypothetical protein
VLSTAARRRRFRRLATGQRAGSPRFGPCSRGVSALRSHALARSAGVTGRLEPKVVGRFAAPPWRLPAALRERFRSRGHEEPVDARKPQHSCHRSGERRGAVRTLPGSDTSFQPLESCIAWLPWASRVPRSEQALFHAFCSTKLRFIFGAWPKYPNVLRRSRCESENVARARAAEHSLGAPARRLSAGGSVALGAALPSVARYKPNG